MSAARTFHTIRRREFIGLGAASLAATWFGGCNTDALGPTPALEPSLARVPQGGTRNALRIPSIASSSNLTLNAAPGVADLGGGQNSAARLYNGEFPGPTIVANNGGAASIRFTNGLSQHSITHWHGMLVDHEDDGHPRQAVAPGGSYDYDFTISQRAALNWYHPHPHMHTGEQVYHGLAGAFIIRDAEESALNLPSGAYEVPLIIRDASFDSAGNLKLGGKASGFWGTEPLVNGTRNPFFAVNKAVYRFRVLNGSNARVWTLAFADARAFTLIGNDGGLLATPVSLSQITLAPGERVDLIVDFRQLAAAASAMLRCVNAGWNVIEFRGTGVAGGGTVPTGTLSTITQLTGSTVPDRTFSFDGMSKINGKIYDISRIDFEVPRGVVQRWRFRTNGNAPHPVHVHGAQFQVQSRTGGRGVVFPWESGWKDTVLLSDFETVDVLIRFERAGEYLLHCHQLAHEDQGMMSNFVVA